MNFYHFSENCDTKYVSVIDILNPSELTFKSCSKCGADNLVKWGNVTPVFECETVTKNRQLPDLMLYGGSMLQSFDEWSIVSDKVKDLCEKQQFSGIRFYPVELCFQKRGTYTKLDFEYYIMSVTGRARIDFEAMNVSCSICDVCGHHVFPGRLFPLTTRNGVYPTIIDTDSWDGSDVFNHNDCTERFAEGVLQAGLSGFEFIDFKQKYASFKEKKYFKTLKELNKIKRGNEVTLTETP